MWAINRSSAPSSRSSSAVASRRSRSTARRSSQQALGEFSSASWSSANSVRRRLSSTDRSVQCAPISRCRCRKAFFAPPARRPIPRGGSVVRTAGTTSSASSRTGRPRASWTKRSASSSSGRAGRGKRSGRRAISSDATAVPLRRRGNNNKGDGRSRSVRSRGNRRSGSNTDSRGRDNRRSVSSRAHPKRARRRRRVRSDAGVVAGAEGLAPR